MAVVELLADEMRALLWAANCATDIPRPLFRPVDFASTARNLQLAEAKLEAALAAIALEVEKVAWRKTFKRGARKAADTLKRRRKKNKRTP